MRHATLAGMELVTETTTEYAKTYSGPAEKCAFTFSTGPEQLDFVFGWVRDRYIESQIDAIHKEGGRVLSIKIWQDTSPTWTTKYRGEIVADVRGEANFHSPFPWLLVIMVGLASVIILFVIKPTIEAVTELIWGREGEDGAKAFPWTWLIIGGVALIALAPRKGRKRDA